MMEKDKKVNIGFIGYIIFSLCVVNKRIACIYLDR